MTRTSTKLMIVLGLLVLLQVGEARSETVIVTITSLDRRFDQLVPKDAKLEKSLMDSLGLRGLCGTSKAGICSFLTFSLMRSTNGRRGRGRASISRSSGYSGTAPFAGKEPGSNGLTLDGQGRLVLCRHGDRQIGRLESNGVIVPLADHYDGHKINSPNDLVFKSNGDLYFTDPPFRLPHAFADSSKAPVQGVYRLSKDGTVTLLIHDIKAPNGIAFSPDEKMLYVSDVNPKRAAWLAYDVNKDGTVTNGRVFFDATRWRQDPFFGPDGFKVDQQGNIFGARPGGLSVIASDGTLLGTIETGQPTSNVAWGEDGQTLFITGGSSVYRLRLTTGAARY